MGAIARQGTFSIVFIFLGFAIGIISNIYFLPKWFSKEELGQVQYFISWGLVVAQFISLGSGTLAVRYYSKWKQEGREGIVLFICLIFPLVGAAIFSLFMLLFGSYAIDATTDKLLIPIADGVLLVIIYSIVQSYIKSYSGLAIALKRVWLNFLFNEVFIRLALLIVYGFCFYGYISYISLLYLVGVAYLMQLVLIVAFQGMSWYKNFTVPDKKSLRETVSYGTYALLDSGANVLVNRLDILLVIMLLGDEGIAQGQVFAMALNIITIIMMPWRSITTSASPHLAEAVNAGDYKTVESVYKKASVNSLLTGGFLFVLIVCGIGEIFQVIPDDYSAATWPVIVLGLARLTDMASSVNHVIIILTPFYRWNLYFNLMVVLVCLIANIVLVPIYGILGSALASMAGVLAFNLTKGIFVYKKLGIHPFTIKTLNSVVLLGAICGLGLILPTMVEHPFLNLVIKSAILTTLFAVAILYLHVSEDMRKLGRKYLRLVGIRLKD